MSQETLFCPAGICCLMMILAGLTVWWHSHMKWPAISAMGQTMAGAAFMALVLVVPGVANAQDEMSRDQAKTEAEDLASGLESQIEGGTAQTINGDTVPSFVTDNPSETIHYGNPAGLENAGLAATITSESAGFINDSISSRPIVTSTELAEWTGNGLAIEGDAQAIVTEYGGTYGDCTTTISGGSTGTEYRYNCNEGETLLEFSDTCDIPLNITFEEDYVYRCTWNWIHNGGTYAPNSDCEPLFTDATCSNWTYISGNLCLAFEPWDCPYGSTDLVLETTCTDTKPGLTPIRTIQGDPIDTWDGAACDLKDADPHCSFLGEVCIEPAATRVIGSQSITRDCWRAERTYECAALGGVTDDCDVPPDCVLEASTCLSSDDDTDECRTYEHTYVCSSAGSTGGAVGYCEDDVYCIDGDCETITRPQNTEFSQAVSALSVLGELQNDVDQATLEIFPGEYAKCDKAVAGLQNCCSNDGFLVSIGFGCSADDKALADRQEAGLCHYNGTYCSKKTLFGICLKKRKTFCCFNNKLARIIHEQGRPQVGRDWGSVKSPDCSGFTVALFQMLDLSIIDFSEFYNDVLDGFSGPDTDAATAAIITRITDSYACPPNC